MLASAATSYACCQAKSAILFPCKEAIDKELRRLTDLIGARVPQRIFIVLSVEEANAIRRLMRDGSALAGRSPLDAVT